MKSSIALTDYRKILVREQPKVNRLTLSFREIVRRLVQLVQRCYLTGATCVGAIEAVVFFIFLCFLAVLVAGAVGSVFGASAANIMGTATAVAKRVIAIVFIFFLLGRLLLSAFYIPIMRFS